MNLELWHGTDEKPPENIRLLVYVKWYMDKRYDVGAFSIPAIAIYENGKWLLEKRYGRRFEILAWKNIVLPNERGEK